MRKSSRPAGFVAVLITCPGRAMGETIGRALVEERLAACVNVIPSVRSIYRWEGKTRRDTEVLLLIKTRRTKLPALQRRVKSLHPYTVPEIVALPITAGSTSYLTWMQETTR